MAKRGKRTRYPGVTRLPDGRYRVRVTARDRRRAGGKQKEAIATVEGSVHDAKRVLDELRERLTNPEAEKPRMTVAAFARSWAAERAPHLAASTRYQYAHVLDRWVLPELGDLFVDAVAKHDVVAWMNQQHRKGYKPATINGRLRVLRTLLRAAAKDCGIVDPAGDVEPFEEQPREDALIEIEVAQLLEAVRQHEPEWYALVATLALTGLRFGEATALQWDDLDREAGIIRVKRAQWRTEVKPPKNKRKRFAPLSAELLATLDDWRAELLRQQHPGLEAGWCFPAAGGGLHVASSVIRKPLAECATKAELGKPVTAQVLRRSFEDRLRRMGVGGVLAEAVMGHNAQMRSRYSTVAEAEVAELGRRIAGTSAGT